MMLVICGLSTISSQEVIQIRKDTVLYDTWVFTNDTVTYDFNMNEIIFKHDNPKFKIVDSVVEMRNFYPSDRSNWGGSNNGGFSYFIGDGYSRYKKYKNQKKSIKRLFR